MDILTKICIVILVPLILMACVVFVNLAAEPARYNELYKQQQERATVYEKTAQFALLGEQQAKVKMDLVAKTADADRARLTADLEAKRVELEKMQSAYSQLKRNTDDITARLTVLDKKVEQQDEERKKFDERIAEAQKEIAKSEKVVADLNKDVLEARNKAQGLAQTLRVRDEAVRELNERIAKLERDLKEARTTTGTAVASGKAAEDTEVVINGAVDAVRGELVQLNIGTAQGVRKGMKMIIYRDTHFVGRVEISEVQAAASGGRIVDKQLDPQKGDKVTSSLK